MDLTSKMEKQNMIFFLGNYSTESEEFKNTSVHVDASQVY